MGVAEAGISMAEGPRQRQRKCLLQRFRKRGENVPLPHHLPPTWTDCSWSCRGDHNETPTLPSMLHCGSLHPPGVSSGLLSSKKPSLAAPTVMAHPSLLPARFSLSGLVWHLGGGAAPQTGRSPPKSGSEPHPYGLLCGPGRVQQVRVSGWAAVRIPAVRALLLEEKASENKWTGAWAVVTE